MTTPLRTAVDCAFDRPVYRSLPIIDSAVRAVTWPDRRARRAFGVMTVDEARTSLEQMVLAQGQRQGAVRARAAVALADPFAESPGESVLRWAAAAAGLPLPTSQFELRAGEWYYIDLAFDGLRVAWEFDGLGKLASSKHVRAEKQRELRIQREGWTVMRFGWEDVMSPERLLQRVCRVMAPHVQIGRARPDLRR